MKQHLSALPHRQPARSNKSLLITGLRGVGKTVLLTAFADRAEERGWLSASVELDSTRRIGPVLARLVRKALYDLRTMERVKQRALRALGVLKAFTVTINDIELRVGNYGSVGGAIGSVAGAIGGMLLAAAICAALGIATFGIGLIACALIIALGAAVGAAVGGLAGAAIGGGIGWIADQFSDFDRKGKSVQNGCQMFMTGRWVTDLSHQHNEIHDLDSAVLIDCGVSSSGQGLTLAGAVGTGRHPGGVDP